MSAHLENLRNRKYVGVVELAKQAGVILAEIGTTQDRGTVSELPDERTLRYYLAEGLLSPTREKKGTASVFGYQHLLQLLVVKKLQSEHLSIRKIKELVEGRTGRELERLLGLDAKAGAKKEAHSYLDNLLTRTSSPASPALPLKQNFSSPATISKSTPNLSKLRQSASSGPATWERIEIEPGLELHLRGDYALPGETEGVRQLARLILNTLETQRRKN